MSGARRIERALSRGSRDGAPALVAFLTAGYPDRDRFAERLSRVRAEADVVEVGVPFSDPMADGVTIQRSSRVALEQGVNLRWILETLPAAEGPAPILLMSYLNPLLAFGLDDLAHASAAAGVDGFIVPDLPLEESAPLRQALAPSQLALVQLVTPVTPAPRLERLCHESEGFVYAVTVTGTTGGDAPAGDPGGRARLLDYLDRVRSVSSRPVCAGFGIRAPEQVAALAGHADGVIVGSALIEELEAGRDPAAFLRRLRGGAARTGRRRR